MRGLVRAGGLEPPRAFAPRIFIPTTAFAAAPKSVCGLDYPFTIAFALGAARLVSTPSPKGLARDCHLTGFPEFEQVYAGVSNQRTQSFKSDASTIPPRPHTVSRIDVASKHAKRKLGLWA